MTVIANGVLFILLLNSIDLEEHCAPEKVDWLEQTVREHVPAASSKRTPNLLLCTLPMSDCASFPGDLLPAARRCVSSTLLN